MTARAAPAAGLQGLPQKGQEGLREGFGGHLGEDDALQASQRRTGAIVARAIGPILFSNPPDEFVLAVLGARVRAIREARGLTQQQVAEQLDVRRPWLTRVEGGRLSPSPGRLRALCLVLNCDPAVLLML